MGLDDHPRQMLNRLRGIGNLLAQVDGHTYEQSETTATPKRITARHKKNRTSKLKAKMSRNPTRLEPKGNAQLSEESTP